MDLAVLFFYSFIIGFSGAMMPGPLLAVDIAETDRTGWLTGPIISAGHAVAEIGIVLLLALGVVYLTDNQVVVRLIGGVGGAALLVMGGMMAWDVWKKKLVYSGETGRAGSGARLAVKGITATLVNPYWFIWWATTGLALLVKSKDHGATGPVVFYVGHILSDFVWYTVVSLMIWKGRRLVAGQGMRVLILACSAFLIYLGAKFIYDSLTGAL